ncbi:Mrp/NBP35 family ATP-binding protein [Sediminitomix flava]|uniref:Iron-sulfur cluster carrier protein n=1 Tax=Sediminitomix flava TaxID=379075 RepID=A0A315ZGN4_SEDFL|nr:Mrp/NBP35 family ATP-binding protein [Sediminitomix flava]PWJ44502.1 ATP-binding protein involved in chromosome partitioning [Sediminitomix flava]
MSFTEKDVINALRHVDDPDLKKDLITLNMVKDVKVEGKKVSFTVVLTTPACPLKERIRQDCENAVKEHVAEDLELDINMTATVTSYVADKKSLSEVKNVIAIASGKGGVGKSTVTANLAVALAQTGAKVGIIDADIYGPSMPTMFNMENARPGVVEREGKTMMIPVEQYGVKILSIGFLTQPQDAVIWRGPMASSALRQFITDTEWGELDYLFVDLPPGTGDIHLSLVQNASVTGAVIVTTPQKVALADAQRGLSMFQSQSVNVPVLGVVENMAYFTPEELPDNQYYIFGRDGGKLLSSRYEVPFLGEVPIVQGIREGGDAGEPIVMDENSPVSKAFARIAEELARNVAIRNAAQSETERVEIKTWE